MKKPKEQRTNEAKRKTWPKHIQAATAELILEAAKNIPAKATRSTKKDNGK